eukprot:SAG31_NODE_14682_length_793_cov_0.913545_2_plen_66_part_01
MIHIALLGLATGTASRSALMNTSTAHVQEIVGATVPAGTAWAAAMPVGAAVESDEATNAGPQLLPH